MSAPEANRRYKIDWKSLQLFKYDIEDKPTALQGKDTTGKITCRIGEMESDPGNYLAIFFKQRKNKQIVDGAYRLNQLEIEMFLARFQPLQ